MKDSFANKYWKEFELLSLEYIRDQYKDSTVKCIHTSYVNDGGYDGSLSLTLTKSNAPFVHEVINLIEAKLRTNSNINIHDFAASIIAAYNFSAHILYVISNTNFTEETKKITKLFSDKTNLQIVLIDGKHLLVWLQKKYLLNNNQFYKDLAASIETNITAERESNICPKAKEKKTKLLPEIFSETIFMQSEKLFGIYTKKVFNEMVSRLEKLEWDKRTIILSGASGTGKSTLIAKTAYEMQQKNYLFSIFDGDNEEGVSVRTVYIWVLKSLWGIDPTLLYTEKNIAEYIDLICFTTKTPIDMNVKETIREVFDADREAYMAKSDLYVAYLLRYLDEILKDKKGKNRSILAFKNLHHLEFHVLEFVIPLIQHLIQNNVGIIIELSSPETLRSHNQEWNRYHDIIYQFKRYGILYELKDFEKEDALDYLSENLPGLAYKYYEYILTYIGLKPIFLKYAIDWLILNEVVIADTNKIYYTVAKPDEFFNGITPNQNLRIIEDIIRHYQEGAQLHDNSLSMIFELAILMEGSLKISLIKRICHIDTLSTAIHILLNTGLFVQIGNYINISHELVLNALKNVSLPYYHFIVAEKLYENIDYLEDKEIIRFKKIDLLEVLGRWDTLYENAQELANELFGNGQYKKSIKYFALCRKYYEKIKYQNHACLLDIFYFELFAYHKIGMGAQQKVLFSNYQQYLEIERSKGKRELPIYHCALEKMYQARLSDSRKQYDLACEMFKYAKQNINKIVEELYVEICYVFALIEKKYTSLTSAVQFLEEQKNMFPASIELDIYYQSHEAAKYLNTNPTKAMVFYENIIKYSGISKRNNKNIGHAYVDILTCCVLSENWKLFEEKYLDALEYVQTNAQYGEEGRIYNLDGLYYWIKNELKVSEKYFRNAQFYLGLVHNRNTDILVKINFVGLLIEQNKLREATVELKVAYDLFKKTYRILFQQIAITKDYRNSREYVALLALIKYAAQLGEKDIVKKIIQENPINDLACHATLIEQGVFPNDVFENTCIIHANIVTLTR